MSALTRLLIDNGVITELEYWESQVQAWRDEVHTYEQRLSARLGTKVNLL